MRTGKSWSFRASAKALAATIFMSMAVSTFAAEHDATHVKKWVGIDGLTTPSEGLAEGQSVGTWQIIYSGFGSNKLITEAGQTRFELCPMASHGAGAVDHAAMSFGEFFGDNLVFSATVRNDEQLWDVNQIQPWHAPWLVFCAKDKQNFYYVITKTNGYELGKLIDGKQIFLATGSDTTFRLGQAVNVEIKQSAGHIQVKIDGKQLIDYADPNPYTSGRIGLYTECSRVSFWNISADSD